MRKTALIRQERHMQEEELKLKKKKLKSGKKMGMWKFRICFQLFRHRSLHAGCTSYIFWHLHKYCCYHVLEEEN